MPAPTDHTGCSHDLAPNANLADATEPATPRRWLSGVAIGALLALGSLVVLAVVSSGRLDTTSIAVLVVVFAAVALLVGHMSRPFLRGLLHRRHRDDDDDDEMIDISERLSQVLPGGAAYGADTRVPSEPPPFRGVMTPTG